MQTPVLATLQSAFMVTVLLGSHCAGDGPPGGIRLSATVEDPRVKAGESTFLAVTVELPSGWIVYDIEQAPNSVLPTRITLDPIDGVAAAESFRSVGALERPEPRFGNRVARYFDSSPTFRRPLIVSEEAREGELRVRGRVTFLAKNEPTGLFYVVSDAPFEAPIAIGHTAEPAAEPGNPIAIESAHAGDEMRTAKTFAAPARPDNTSRAERPKKAPSFRVVVTKSAAPLQASEPPPPFLAPLPLGALLILTGACVGFGLPPAVRRQRPAESAVERRAA